MRRCHGRQNRVGPTGSGDRRHGAWTGTPLPEGGFWPASTARAVRLKAPITTPVGQGRLQRPMCRLRRGVRSLSLASARARPFRASARFSAACRSTWSWSARTPRTSMPAFEVRGPAARRPRSLSSISIGSRPTRRSRRPRTPPASRSSPSSVPGHRADCPLRLRICPGQRAEEGHRQVHKAKHHEAHGRRSSWPLPARVAEEFLDASSSRTGSSTTCACSWCRSRSFTTCWCCPTSMATFSATWPPGYGQVAWAWRSGGEHRAPNLGAIFEATHGGAAPKYAGMNKSQSRRP